MVLLLLISPLHPFGSHLSPVRLRWKPKVRTISSASGVGIEQLWADACMFRERGVAGIKEMRGRQRGYWMWQEAAGMLERSLKTSPRVQKLAGELQVFVFLICCSVDTRSPSARSFPRHAPP
jgi:putative protein kinase ArgK-like GTPase of G3E family